MLRPIEAEASGRSLCVEADIQNWCRMGQGTDGDNVDAGFSKGDFPVAEKIADETLSLPMFPHMTVDQVKEVARALKEAV